MDRRTLLGAGLGSALLPATSWAQPHETGFLPGDSEEFIALGRARRPAAKAFTWT